MLNAADLLRAIRSPTDALQGPDGYLGIDALRDPIGTDSVLAPSPAGGLDHATLGGILLGAGALASTVGSFFAVRSAQSAQKSQALSMEFEASMAALNARRAEQSAQDAMKAGGAAIARRTLAAGQEAGSAAATMAGRGIASGVGSAAEVQASIALAKEIDTMSITANAVREANAARTGAVNYRTRASLAGLSARNLRGSAGNDLAAGAAAGGSVLGLAARIGERWSFGRRYPEVE
jgi:hypothetical protein